MEVQDVALISSHKKVEERNFITTCMKYIFLIHSSFQTLFDVIDTNKDDYTQLEEFQYACLYYIFSSGPDSPLSVMFGSVPDEEN